jgi:ABC-type transport system involved in multi-copper enzyme maturation permease subunit
MDPDLLRKCNYLINPSDLITALCYYVIPFLMFYIWQARKDLPLTSLFLMFGFFIVCCGTTHLITIFMTFNSPRGGLIAMTAWKCITAIVSFITGLMLIHSIPLALSIPSREQLELEITVHASTLFTRNALPGT